MDGFADPQLNELLGLVLQQKPQPADAIVWLQGDQLDRGPKVVELYKAGFASTIFLVGNNVQVAAGSRPGELDLPLGELANWLESQGVPARAIIVDDRALNAHEQAVRTVAAAKTRDWKIILLVASPYHQVRAFLTFVKATIDSDMALDIINQPAGILWGTIPSGRVKTAEENLVVEEKKIHMYLDHVAPATIGLALLHKH